MARRPRKHKSRKPARKIPALVNPAAPLVGPDLRKAAHQVTDAAIAPTVGAYNKQIGDTQRQGAAVQSRAGDYYRQIAQQALEGVSRQKGIADVLGMRTQAVGNQALQSMQGHLDDQSHIFQMDEGVRGTGLGGNVQPVVAAQNQARDALLAGQLAGNQSAASQGANWQGLANIGAMATGMRGGEQQAQLGARTLNTVGVARQKLADFKAQHANDYGVNLQKLRQQSFENEVTKQGLGIKQQDLVNAQLKIQQDARKAAAARRDARRALDKRLAVTTAGQNLSHADRVRQQDLTHQDRVTQQAISAAKTGTGKSGKPLTPLQRRAARATAAKSWSIVDNSLGLMDPRTARQPILGKDGKPTGKTRAATQAETVQFLRGKKTPEWAIQASLSIRHHGFILPSVLKKIKAANPYIRIPSQYLPGGVRSYNGPH